MLPVLRWFVCGMAALWSCSALAQAAAAQPEIDESKIPEWVKRQARSPYKVIIDSNAVKAKPSPLPTPAPAPAKDDPSAKVVAKKAAPRTTASAAPDSDKPAPLPGATAALPSTSAAIARPLVAGALADPAAVLLQPAGEITAAVPMPAAMTAATAATAALATRPAAAEPALLTLVKRVEPLLAAELLDGRLNTAKVVVAFTVNPNGEVSNLSVASTTDSRLNRSILRAVQAWRYAPIPEPREHMVSFAFSTE